MARRRQAPEGLPRLHIASNSGARIGLAEELKRDPLAKEELRHQLGQRAEVGDPAVANSERAMQAAVDELDELAAVTLVCAL